MIGFAIVKCYVWQGGTRRQVNFGGMFGRVVQDAKLTLVGCLACYTGMNKLLLCPFHYQVSTYLIFATELSQKIPTQTAFHNPYKKENIPNFILICSFKMTF